MTFEAFYTLVGQNSLIPGGYCYLWQRVLLWLHGGADAAIALSCGVIAIVLLYVARRRGDLPFRRLLFWGAALAIAYSLTHLLTVWTLWIPFYWISGGVKTLTALLSLYTALELVAQTPEAVAVASRGQFRVLNQSLYQEMTERQAIEAALEASEDKFCTIFDQSFQFMSLLQPDGRIMAANQSALRFGHLSVDEVVGGFFWQVPWWSFSADTQTQMREAIATAANGQVMRYETEIIHIDHDHCPSPSSPLLSGRPILDFSITPIRDEQGRVSGLIAEGRDMTLLKSAEAEVRSLNADLERRVHCRTAQLEVADQQNKALLQKESAARTQLEQMMVDVATTTERLELALQGAQMGFWDWDLTRQSQVWSPETEAILGYQHDEVEHSYDNWARRVHPKDLKQVSADIKAVIERHVPLKTQYRLVMPNGLVRWIEAQGRLVVSSDQQPRRLVGTIRDVTQSVQAEQSLKLSEARFRALFEQAAVGMARFAPDGRWIQVNQKLCDLLGYTPDEMLQRTVRDITDSADIEIDRNYYQQLVTGQLESCTYEKRYLHKNGDSIWTMITLSKEYKASGRILCFIAVIEDICDRKRAQQEVQRRARELSTLNILLAQTATLLEERNAELNQFAYVASHDLKAPLRAIANLSQWIEEDLGDRLPPENEHQLRLMRGRVNRMEALINGLLEYSRVGRRNRMVETVNVNALIANTIDSLAPPDSFDITAAPQMPDLTTHAVALQQVFANLISNAIKHHDRSDGHISIGVQDLGWAYQFEVSDDGPGIDPQYHDKVFGIFQTLKARDEAENTGIGLSLVKKIIETEGGSIQIDSALGKGTTFRFIWPQSNPQ